MVKQRSSHKLALLYDIRLKGTDHDVIILKGSEHYAASTFLSGKIVVAINEPMTIKKITLRLYATLRLKGSQDPPKHSSTKPTRFEKKIYEYVFDSSTFMKYLGNMYENTANGGSGSPHESSTDLSRPHALVMTKNSSMKGSSTSLKNLGLSLRSKSSNSLSTFGNGLSLLSQSGSSTNLSGKNGHTLVSGNYEIPFSAILPGNMPESVEGLPGASVIYKLESTIDRGKFHNHMTTKKLVRVVRTMTTDSVELSETVAVDNTWPKKVEYSISVPSKAIAIGSGTPISMMLVPLLKGLRLGEIRISLVEQSTAVGYVPPPQQLERNVAEKTIPKPREDDPNFQLDKWEITTFLRIPPSLSKCTQDCEIKTHLKVRHKLKFVVCLINPDGHTSELRASLPVQLFISPFVMIRAKHDEDDVESINEADIEEEEVLFEADSTTARAEDLAESNSQTESGSELRSNPHSVSSFTGLVAPPVYERHVYDQLWSDISPAESPIDSGTASPRILMLQRPGNDVSQFSMNSIDTARLTENLRQLSIQRQLEHSSVASTPRERAVFNLDDGEGDDYFSGNRLVSPGSLNSPSFAHMSRVGSDSHLSDRAEMSKVPSYFEAIRNTVGDTLSPVYTPPMPGSNVNLTEANRRFDEQLRSNLSSSPQVPSSNRLFLSRGLSLFSLKGSRTGSGGNSPVGSAKSLTNNLISLAAESRTPRKNIRLTGGATFTMAPGE